MLVATALGVFIIPGNYTFVEGLGRRKKTETRARSHRSPYRRSALNNEGVHAARSPSQVLNRKRVWRRRLVAGPIGQLLAEEKHI